MPHTNKKQATARGDRISKLLSMVGGIRRDETLANAEALSNVIDAEGRVVESLPTDPVEGAPKYNEL